MKDFLICDCVENENKIIVSSFVVVSKQVKPKKTGEPYLALTLGDRTGQLEAKMWDNVEDAFGAFEQEDFIKIKGLLNKYKNRFQITIHKASPAGRFRSRFRRLSSQDHQGHRRVMADAGGVCCQLSESPSEGAGRSFHG